MSYEKKKFLPHLDMAGYYQFVTFRTYDSLDDFVLKIRKKDIPDKQKEFEVDQYLDRSLKGCYLNGAVLEYLKKYFIGKDKTFYELIAFSIMPNHVHMIFKQNDNLSKIMQQIKGGTSYKINKMLQREGKFWEDNYYDKVIRDKRHFDIVYEYIKNNALKANLEDAKERFYSVYE